MKRKSRKTFYELSPKHSVGLDRFVFINAHHLQKDALLIAKENASYSTAISLMVLSIEEMIKATLILLHSYGYEVYKIKHAQFVFHDHKTRHNYANLINVFSGIIELVPLCEKIIETTKTENKNQSKTTVDHQTGEEALQVLENFCTYILTAFSCEKIDEFNFKKNFGFYVDYQDIYSDKKAEHNIAFFEYIVKVQKRLENIYKTISIVHHPKVVNRVKKDEYIKIKSTIEDLLSDIDKLNASLDKNNN
ncbi:AbiV family abortive infection protein [Flavobacterium sp.]|uniref:AbiV family abortive infection protein n=1 Tax=Flavobacterium sp. TaxID=239 RepID=UPI002B4B75D5|nr:AbiV family abortive infection protein [Flavobacterium sp.]HLP64757.1 AbiV family abortive infection protein [Flavobacterium sp.]